MRPPSEPRAQQVAHERLDARPAPPHFTLIARPAKLGYYGQVMKSQLANRLAWVTIVVFLLLTCVWGVWAGRQPEVQTVWAPGNSGSVN